MQVRLQNHERSPALHTSVYVICRQYYVCILSSVIACKLIESSYHTLAWFSRNHSSTVFAFFISSVVVASPSAHPQRPAYQARTRRLSSVSSRAGASLNNSAAVDDFEELMKEFSDDRLEDEIELDPAKGEDDLLLELSEMIGS